MKDVHCADHESTLAITSAIKRLDKDRLIVIVTSRRSRTEDWDRLICDEDRCSRLSLGGFNVHEIASPRSPDSPSGHRSSPPSSTPAACLRPTTTSTSWPVPRPLGTSTLALTR
jgi:hypothetical protein